MRANTEFIDGALSVDFRADPTLGIDANIGQRLNEQFIKLGAKDRQSRSITKLLTHYFGQAERLFN